MNDDEWRGNYKVFGVGEEHIPGDSQRVDVHHPVDGRYEHEVDQLSGRPHWTVGLMDQKVTMLI